jgi:hypothetical protein
MHAKSCAQIYDCKAASLCKEIAAGGAPYTHGWPEVQRPRSLFCANVKRRKSGKPDLLTHRLPQSGKPDLLTHRLPQVG